jgi:hypothetical protein
MITARSRELWQYLIRVWISSGVKSCDAVLVFASFLGVLMALIFFSGQVRILVLDHPEEKLLEDGHVVKEGVLLEGPAKTMLCMLDGLYPRINRPKSEGGDLWYEPPPSQKGIGELIGPSGTDSTRCPSLGNKFADEPGIIGTDPFLMKIP